MIYPKARSPLTQAVLNAANARAERWLVRCKEARAECDRLQALLDAQSTPTAARNQEQP